jgi:acyl phosphate:glycerol-3-phosphate acyltransferase
MELGSQASGILAVVLAYLIGSVSFAVLVSRFMGLPDPHSYGSGNPGATNVLRSGNKLAALLTLVGDAAKGALAVGLARAYAARWGLGDGAIACVGLAAFIGHLFPVFHRFAGGKGVATAAGVLLTIDPMLGFAVLATWILMAFFFRYSSLAALTAAALAPVYQVLFRGLDATALAILVMSALLIWRHRPNIVNLMAGRERRIGEKRAA